VKTYASTPVSRNAISNVRSVIDPGSRTQLIGPWLDQRSPALLVDVQPVGCAGRFAVDQHAERDDRARPRAQDEMDVARMDGKGDSPPASFSTLARSSIVQFPPRAQVLS
jgi:hypothetical protein